MAEAIPFGQPILIGHQKGFIDNLIKERFEK